MDFNQGVEGVEKEQAMDEQFDSEIMAPTEGALFNKYIPFVLMTLLINSN